MTSYNTPTTCAEAESFRSESRFIYKWTFHGFDCVNTTNDEELPSVKFDFKLKSDMHFHAKLFLFGLDCLSRKCVFNLRCSTHKDWTVMCNFLTNQKRAGNAPLKCDDKNNVYFNMYKKKLEINTPGNCYLVESKNTITCEIVHVSYIEKPKPSLIKIKEFTLHCNLEVLFKSKKFSDVVFEVAGRELYAHKCILSCRSKVFADIFERQMTKGKSKEESTNEADFNFNESKLIFCPPKVETQEDQSSNVIIADMEPEVFEEILRFIYTEEVLNLDKIPSRLLVGGAKYGLEKLKSMCENHLAGKISIETAAETLILADLHGALELRQLSIDFIKKHSKAISTTKGWQNIVNNHINLLAELYNEVIQ